MTRILLVTRSDETYRRPLLESQGYQVETIRTLAAAKEALLEQGCDIVLIAASETPADMSSFYSHMRENFPKTRLARVVGPGEDDPGGPVDAVIQPQQGPVKFLEKVRELLPIHEEN